MARSDHLFQRLCIEAAAACGSDVAAVERYVHERVARLSEEDRSLVQRDIDRVLRFRSPNAGMSPPH